MDEKIKITNKTIPSNDIVFGLVFQDKEIFKMAIKCILNEDLDDSSYVVSQKEEQMDSSVYNKIRFDVYAEGPKIYTLDMQNGYPKELIKKRLVYYACRAVGGQKVKKGEYDKLKTCVITFLFEKSSYKNNQFFTQYYIASEDNGKIKKYSDLLTIVEINLKYYKGTKNNNLNILCQFLKIQNDKDLSIFYDKYVSTEFGKILYSKYIKVILDNDILERVENMNMYQEKYQLRYHTVDEAKAIEDKKEKKVTEKIALRLLKTNKYSIEDIAESTELTVDKVKKLKERIEKNKNK